MIVLKNTHPEPTDVEIMDAGRLGNKSSSAFYADARLRLDAQERLVAELRKAQRPAAAPLTPAEDEELNMLLGLEFSRNIKSARLQELDARRRRAMASPEALAEFLAAVEKCNELVRQCDYFRGLLEAEKGAAKAREDAAATIAKTKAAEAERVAQVEAELEKTRQAGAVSTSISFKFDAHGNRIA